MGGARSVGREMPALIPEIYHENLRIAVFLPCRLVGEAPCYEIILAHSKYKPCSKMRLLRMI